MALGVNQPTHRIKERSLRVSKERKGNNNRGNPPEQTATKKTHKEKTTPNPGGDRREDPGTPEVRKGNTLAKAPQSNQHEAHARPPARRTRGAVPFGTQPPGEKNNLKSNLRASPAGVE